jgi:hypothetical protein
MLGQHAINRFAWMYSLHTTATTTPGVAVTPANGSKGTYAQLASGANLTQDVWGVWLWISQGATTGTPRPIRLDLGIDPAGGTTYTAKIPDILCGLSSTYALGVGYLYYFPLRIKAGSSVGVAAWGIETATLRVVAKFFGRPTNPQVVRAGTWAETVGTPSGAGGVSVTPSNSNGAMTWATLGTSVRRNWWWQLSVQCNNGTITALAYKFDLAWGDGTNKTMIQEHIPFLVGGTAESVQVLNSQQGFADVPAGATLYVRGTCSGTAVTGFTALAHGIGG